MISEHNPLWAFLLIIGMLMAAFWMAIYYPTMLTEHAPSWVYVLVAGMAVAVCWAMYVGSSTAMFTSGAILFAYIILANIWYPPPPRKTIREIYDELQHKCTSLRHSPMFAALPRDILHNYITPMAKNIDIRTVFVSGKYCFADATVEYRDADPFSPTGVRIRGPTSVPTPNPIDKMYKKLQSKEIIDRDEYLGGSVFANGNKLFHLRDRALHQLPIYDIKDYIILRRLIIAKHYSKYTFLSPTNLMHITVQRSQLSELEQRFLEVQFDRN